MWNYIKSNRNPSKVDFSACVSLTQHVESSYYKSLTYTEQLRGFAKNTTKKTHTKKRRWENKKYSSLGFFPPKGMTAQTLCRMCWKYTRRQMRGKGGGVLWRSIQLHAAEGAEEGRSKNSPWSFNGKTSRPKEVGSSWEGGVGEGEGGEEIQR